MCNWKKIFLSMISAGVILSVLGIILSMVVLPLIYPGMMTEYQNGAYRPWDDPLMSYIYIHPFVIGLVLAFAYDLFRPFPKVKPYWRNGLYYGLVMWLVATVPGMLITYSSYTDAVTSGAMVLVWTIDSLIKMPAAGIVIAKIYGMK